jgi:hypothetical protein
MPRFLTLVSFTSMNFDSIITWSVALSKLSRTGTILPRTEGRSEMIRALMRLSTFTWPPPALSTRALIEGSISSARA